MVSARRFAPDAGMVTALFPDAHPVIDTPVSASRRSVKSGHDQLDVGPCGPTCAVTSSTSGVGWSMFTDSGGVVKIREPD